ncbi:LysR family transcriptional regulator [Paenibacillus sp. NPDC058071]|uniref:LysR family transcriptional regulator n=1 Tax=Paenibacillus sp. NPDC058071 TaxID=3346326 RepID=UPI0036DE35B0
MDIRHLRYFTAVAKHGSFTKAADALHVSQPTLSKMVRLLEEELGCTLFDRSAKAIRLTDAGRTIVQASQQILKSVDHMADELGDLMKLRQGSIRLGVPPMIGAHYVASIIESFRLHYPQIRLELIENGSRVVEAQIEEGELDVGFILTPEQPDRTFAGYEVAEDRMMAVIAADHRLANHETIELGELAEEPMIMFKEDFRLRHLVQDACREAGFEPKTVFESGQWDFIAEMVAVRLGVSLMPEKLCGMLRQDRFAIIPLYPQTVRWRLSLIWNAEHYLSYAAREWIDFVHRNVRGQT